MKYRKTYGVRGLLEWKMTLRAGKAKIKIAFTGGCMGGNGVIPAKYVTENTAIQNLIESSNYFRNGKVYLHGKPVEIAEEIIPSHAERSGKPLTMNAHANQDSRFSDEGVAPDWGDADLEC